MTGLSQGYGAGKTGEVSGLGEEHKFSFDTLFWDDSNARHPSWKFKLAFDFKAQKRSLD